MLEHRIVDDATPQTAYASRQAEGLKSSAAITRYVRTLISAAIATVLGLAAICLTIGGPLSKIDHLGQIPLDDDYRFYRNYGDWMSKEIQDRDILYHGIGQSIERAREADVILLGHSMVLWGFDPAQLREFERKHGVKIYNMASAGDASGEFLRQVAVRWQLHPKLWLLNADDKGGSFFDVKLEDLGMSGSGSAAQVVRHGRLKGYVTVALRNTRWRIQQYLASHLPAAIKSVLLPGPGLPLWRNIEHGDWHLDRMPQYLEPSHNPPIQLTRDQNCAASADEIAKARTFTASIGSTAALMLVPYWGFCPLRVQQIGQALGLDVLILRKTAYTSGDGGGHLDHDGAQAFTADFLKELERLPSFRAITASRTAPPRAP
ncbi:conserved hypothetical protein [Bradyrhizobium sp. ORS 375]|uniref:hypothetical protein n=1 Tax=Bradyrhizobium sp. (strain ORS 375) TaxID=566679 RepID=UPI0002408B1A|nr:hypothetical protein [Bradyrhizobium sp. ORS 375]CCD92692.1 conserved hypothetical protein [Bradyrhizobium sp. ORS 375]